MLKRVTFTVLILLFYMMIATAAVAAPPFQAPGGEEYTVQAGDSLSSIAEKYFEDYQSYTDIVEATNAKAAEDSTFTRIENPDLIEVGQKLWVPQDSIDNADVIAVEEQPFQPVEVEELGIRTVVPLGWPPTENNDPLLKHTWGAGLFSFVSFTTIPGNDVRIGLARLLGVTPESLAEGATGGALFEEQRGDRTWMVFRRDEGGVTSVVAGMVEDKVIYLLSLFSESSQTSTILRAILQNFEVIESTAGQQAVTIEAPSAGIALTSPFELRGSTTEYPFNGRLVYRVLDEEGNQVGRAPFEVVGQFGNPSTFAIPATYNVPIDGPGTVEVVEVSAADGTVIAIDSTAVMLLADPPGYTITIDDPRPFTTVTTPVQIRGKTSDRPFEGRLNYRIVNATGEELASDVIETRGQVGQVNIFDEFVEFDVFENGPGRIELFDIRPADGAIFSLGTSNVWLTPPQ